MTAHRKKFADTFPNDYSVPTEYGHRDVLVKGYCAR